MVDSLKLCYVGIFRYLVYVRSQYGERSTCELKGRTDRPYIRLQRSMPEPQIVQNICKNRAI